MARRGQSASDLGYVARLRDVLASPLGRVLMRVGTVALIALAGAVVMRQARAQAYKIDGYRLDAASLKFADLPGWLDDDTRPWLTNYRPFRNLSVSVFDPEAEWRVRDLVARHPMVREVREVRVIFPKRVVVQPVMRVPVARVGERLLTSDHCLLPHDPYKSYLRGIPHALPEVVGIRSRMPERWGVAWEDRLEQVQEAVEAARVAARLYRDLKGRVVVRTIDVSRFPSRGGNRHLGEVAFTIRLEPVRPGQKPRTIEVQWGRTERDLENVPFEDTYRTKLERLEEQIIARRVPRRLDVRWKQTE